MPDTRKWVKADIAREQLLEAGYQLLVERGLAPGLSRVSLKDAIERSGVNRSSAYVIFSGDDGPLEVFRNELLQYIEDREVDTGEVEATIYAVLAEHEAVIASGDPIGLAVALREVLRRLMETNVMLLRDRLTWRTYLSATVASDIRDLDDASKAARRHAIERSVERYLPMYDALSQIFGIRIREGRDVMELASIVVMALDANAVYGGVNNHYDAIQRNTGPNGEPRLWTAAAVIFEALLLLWIEPDPDAESAADLSAWTLTP